MSISRSISIRYLIILSLGLLAAVGCQSSPAGSPSATPAAASPTTASVATASLATAGLAASTATPVITTPVASARPSEITAEDSEMTGEDTMVDDAPTAVANADVEFVRAVQNSSGAWTFHVTVRHPDTGWEDYADGWDVVTPDGRVLKVDEADPFTRLLLHPHESEQPFTRSQSGIQVPDGVTTVIVRAHDLVDGFGGREVSVDLTAGSGPAFEIERP